jgi:hypothetical protein
VPTRPAVRRRHRRPAINGTLTRPTYPRRSRTTTPPHHVEFAVTGGTVGTLSLSLNITHTFRGDLVVTLSTRRHVVHRQQPRRRLADNIVLTNMAITTFSATRGGAPGAQDPGPQQGRRQAQLVVAHIWAPAAAGSQPVGSATRTSRR